MDMIRDIEFFVTLSLILTGSICLNLTRLRFKEDPEYYASRFFLETSSYLFVVLIVMFWAMLAVCVVTMAFYEATWVHGHMCSVASTYYALAFGLSAMIVSEPQPVGISNRGAHISPQEPV